MTVTGTQPAAPEAEAPAAPRAADPAADEAGTTVTYRVDVEVPVIVEVMSEDAATSPCLVALAPDSPPAADEAKVAYTVAV